MPSPFPGMDPYLENPELWPDVHAELISCVRYQLAPRLEPNYVARVQQRTFGFAADDPADELYVVPDARIVERTPGRAKPLEGRGGGLAIAEEVAVTPALDVTDVGTREARERFIEIRDRAGRRVVTVIEVVSPSNKTVGSAGRRAFIEKREQVGGADVNWLEIDLLRGGAPTIGFPTVPRSAYRAYVDRMSAGGRRQLLWPIALRQRLPVIAVPLLPGEADVPLDLQTVLNTAYDRAAYEADADYAREPVPLLAADDAAWADEVLRGAKLRA